MAECGGAALIVDYGEEEGEEVRSAKEEVANAEDENIGNAEEKNFGNAEENVKNTREVEVKRTERDTLRAFRHHQQVHPLVSLTPFMKLATF